MDLGDFAYSLTALLLAPNELQNTKGSEWSCNKEIHLTPRNFPTYLNRECVFDTAVTNHPTTLYFMKHPWGAIWGSKASERDAKIFIIEKKTLVLFWMDLKGIRLDGMKETSQESKQLKPELRKQK